MQKLINNSWIRKPGEPFAKANILSQKIHPEGLDIDRIQFVEAGKLPLRSSVGHIISLLRGGGSLHVAGDHNPPLNLGSGVHLYIPPGFECHIQAEPGTGILQVSSASATQARGKRLLLRDETFISACASGSQSLRWALTSQYLSRRIFLHHDPILLSKSGNPVSWYRTTMFDVDGLPKNEDGEPVFKMSYNSRTECNICYDVKGTARVRMSLHPYKKTQQAWGAWCPLDGETTYHLNEAAGSPDEERYFDEVAGDWQSFRNKHEVYIADGYVTLFCLFDPAPIGIENHQPGEYSDYEPLNKLLRSKAYLTHRREVAKFDEMVDTLSVAKARGVLDTYHGMPVWKFYLRGRQAQRLIEHGLAETLVSEGGGRGQVVARWMQSEAGQYLAVEGVNQ